MKKILGILLLLIFLTGCSENPIVYDQPSSTISDMSGYGGLESEQFYDTTVDEFLQMVEEGKTAVVYFGYDSCVWCNSLVPVLNEVSIQEEMKIYYVNHYTSENYNNIDGMEKVTELLKDFLNKDDTGEVAFYFPTIVYLQQGKVQDVHIGTVSGHDATVSGLSEKQYARLKYVLEKDFEILLKR